LYNNSPSIANINQNQFGDCFFLAAIGATFGIQTSPSLQTSAIVNNMIIDNGDNSYTVRFYQSKPRGNGYEAQDTSPSYVSVNKEVVTQTGADNQPLFGALPAIGEVSPQNTKGGPIWMPLLERAYAQWHQEVLKKGNGYNAIGNEGYNTEALTQVTGRKSERYDLTKPDVFNTIKSALNKGEFIAAGTIENAESFNINNQGTGVMVGGHAYSIHAAYLNGTTPTLSVYNPWGKDGNNDTSNGGFTQLTLDDSIKIFGDVDVTLI
jgi:hypothetical protein